MTVRIVVLMRHNIQDSRVHGANMGPTWVLSAPDGPHVGPINHAIKACMQIDHYEKNYTVLLLGPWPNDRVTDWSYS